MSMCTDNQLSWPLTDIYHCPDFICEHDPWHNRPHHKANPPQDTKKEEPETSEDIQGGHLLNQALLRHRV